MNDESLKHIIESIELSPEQGEAVVEYVTNYLNKWKEKIETKVRGDYVNAATKDFISIGDKDDALMFRLSEVFYIYGNNESTTVVFKNEDSQCENMEATVDFPIQKSLHQLAKEKA